MSNRAFMISIQLTQTHSKPRLSCKLTDTKRPVDPDEVRCGTALYSNDLMFIYCDRIVIKKLYHLD